MSGPRRHGSRRSAAACAFVLLVLAFALVRGGVASAHGNAPHKHPRHHAAAGLLGRVGGVVTGLGHTVDGVLTHVGAALGNRPHSHPTTPPPTPTPTPTPVGSPPAPHPTPQPPATHAPVPGTGHHSAPAPAGHQPATEVDGVRGSTSRHAPSASPVAATSAGHRPPADRPAHIATALDSPSAEIPGLGLTASLAALMFAMVLGVGLLVYRAGDRGERAA